MRVSPALTALLAGLKTTVNVVWFAMFAVLGLLAAIAYILPLYGMKPIALGNLAQVRGYLEISAFVVIILSLYMRFFRCSSDFLLRKLKKLPHESSGMSARMTHRDYRLNLSPQFAQRFNRFTKGEQRVFIVYSTYCQNLIFALALNDAYSVIGFTLSTLAADHSVIVPYVATSAGVSLLFLLPSTAIPESAVTKARASGLITTI